MTQEVAEREALSLAAELHEVEEIESKAAERSKEIRESLLNILVNSPFKAVTLRETGEVFTVAERESLVLKNERSALAWAYENPEARMKLDTSAAIKVIKMGKIKWGAIEIKAHLRVSKPKARTVESVEER